jgi:hypothetical protein
MTSVQAGNFRFIEGAAQPMQPTGDEEEPVGQDQTPQARHAPDYIALVSRASSEQENGAPKEPQSFKQRNCALPGCATRLFGTYPCSAAVRLLA